MISKQLCSKFRKSVLAIATVKACAVVIGLGLMAPDASAGAIQIVDFTLEEGTYYPGDPVPMSLTVVNAHPTQVSNPVRTDVHLTHGGQFRRPDPITDHVLVHLIGPTLAPGEMWQWNWVQKMPGNLPGNFIVDAESYSGPGPLTTFNGWTLSFENPPMIETAKITLRPEEHPETDIVSIAEDGTSAQGFSETPSISALGRWVAFASEARNLVGPPPDDDDDDNGDDDDAIGPSERASSIYVRDQWTGNVEQITVAFGDEALDSPAHLPRISRDADNIDQDGRWVVFHTAATNLMHGITNLHSDVFLKDRETGELTRISMAHDGETQGNQASQNASVSGDGRYVVFESEATNLLQGDNLSVTGGLAHIYIYDTREEELRRIHNNDGAVLAGGHSRNPRISADGRHVVFESRATNLADEVSGVWEVYVHDRDANETDILDQPGPGDTRTTRLSAAFDEFGDEILSDGHSQAPDLSADGRFVVFHSEATNLFGEPAEGEIVLTGRRAEGLIEFEENEPGVATIALAEDELATGLIRFDHTPSDGDTIQISDGDRVHTFEFDGPFPDGVAPGNVRVFIATEDNDNQPVLTRRNLTRAINEAFLENDRGTIRAEEDQIGGQPGIRLTNLAFGPPEANQPINADNAPTLHVEGMDGAGEVETPESGDVVEIDIGRQPLVFLEFYEAGEDDPTDHDARIIGVQIGQNNKRTSLNILAAFHDLGYHEYDEFMVPEIPENLLPPFMENPRHGESFTFQRGDEDADPDADDAFQEQTFFFTNQPMQLDPANPEHVRIEATPEGTRGNLMRAIATFFDFDELPAEVEATGESFAFSESFGDGPAHGAVRLLQMPEDGNEIIISDGFITTTFRFEDERDQTEEEEELDIPVPPFEVIGAGLVRIYLFEDDDVPVAEMEDRFFNAIQASFLNITVRRGFSPELGADAILLLNNEVGEFGNVPIEIIPLDDDDEDEENGEENGEEDEDSLVQTEWAEAFGMDGGFNENASDGDRVVFYPEDLLHPRVVFEFRFSAASVSEGAIWVPIGSTGGETEGNLLAALHASALPWLTADEPDEDLPHVRLVSIIASATGEITFDFSATNPDPFTFIVEPGEARTPRHGGTITLNDGINDPVTFEFSVDGTIHEEDEEDSNVPVEIAATSAMTRDNLIRAINIQEDENHLNIVAEDASTNDDPAILLTNTVPGPVGNQPILLSNLGPHVNSPPTPPHDEGRMQGGQWNPRQGERFSIADGFNDRVVFEFVTAPGNVSDPQNQPVIIGVDREETRDNLEDAIKASPLRIDVVGTFVRNGNPGVRLQHQVPGPVGNHPIEILTPRPSFEVFGMAGGTHGGPGFEQVYLADRDANNSGTFDQQGQISIELVSITEEGTAANDRSLEPAVSDDGRYVAYRSQANDLLPRTVVRSDGTPFPSIPDSRHWVMFPGNDSGLIGFADATQEIQNWTDADNYSDIYVYDREEGEQIRASVNRFGEAFVGHTGTRRHPYSDRSAAMSSEGRFIVFESNQEPFMSDPPATLDGDGVRRTGGLWHGVTNRHTLDHNGWQDVFIHDRRFPSDAPEPPERSATIVTPSEGDFFMLGEPIRLEALAVSGDSEVHQVEFLFNNEPLDPPLILTSPPYRTTLENHWVPEEPGEYRITALVTDATGRQWMSPVVTVDVHPLGVVTGNPAHVDNHAGFINRMFVDLLGRAPTLNEFTTLLSRLESGEWNRGQVVSMIMEDPEFQNVRWVIGAYYLVLGQAPTLEQFENAMAILADPEDDDIGEDEDIDLNGLPPGIIFVIDDILTSFEFRDKFRNTLDMDPGDTGYDVSAGAFVDQIWEEHLRRDWRTHNQRQQARTQADNVPVGRLIWLMDRLAEEIDEKLERHLHRAALVLMILHRDPEPEHLRALDPDSVASAANTIVSFGGELFDEFCELHGGDCGGPLASPSGDMDWLGPYSLDVNHWEADASEGWIRHDEHSWLYVVNSNTGLWMWDHIQQDWWWTRSEIYPRLYIHGDGDLGPNWYFYHEGGEPSLREFTRWLGNQWAIQRTEVTN